MGAGQSSQASVPQSPPPGVAQPANTPPVETPPTFTLPNPSMNTTNNSGTQGDPALSPIQAMVSGQPPVAKKPENTANPGTYEDIHKKAKEILPMPWEGGKITIGRGLSNHFQINHNINLSTPMQSGYRFGATYVGSKQFGPQESYPIMLGDMDTKGNLNANIIHAFSRNTLTRIVAQFVEEKVNTQVVTDYKGSSYTATVTAANPDLVNGSGLVVGQFLQRVAPKVDIGAECMYQRGGQVPGGQIAVMSLAARINGPTWQFGATVCPLGPGGGPVVHASYYHKINDALQIVSEFETTAGIGECSATAGYQLDVPVAGVTFKGQIDTNLTVQATLEKKLMESQLPFTFALSAVGNQAKSDYKLGVGLMFGS